MDNEIKENVSSKNREAETDKPQIHLSANDSPFAEEATELVFHKMPDGNLFIEWYHHVEDERLQSQTTLSKEAKEKLIEFLNNPKVYE